MSGSLKVLHRGAGCVLMCEDDVWNHLRGISATHYKHIANARAIVTRLSDEGLEAVNNTEQFVFEGRFPDGTRQAGQVAVYAVKAYQLRIYGGFRTLEGERCFICIESTIKKTNKADGDQLRRVAKKLGEYGADAG